MRFIDVIEEPETDCPLCGHPLDGEHLFHMRCADEEKARDEAWGSEPNADGQTEVMEYAVMFSSRSHRKTHLKPGKPPAGRYHPIDTAKGLRDELDRVTSYIVRLQEPECVATAKPIRNHHADN